ncbi:serine hydrolase domain-containing protein [Halobacillus ihumii]|uniref:serine hydrolase domain-containing protein n=1 Tax=Halobacillus ihumii TaxID=2686092 RepID=UPI0013D24E19|nr:serine hydrolase domain-containing protein [Halobacillus ihumii]
MSRKRKVILMGLALMMSLCVAGCSSSHLQLHQGTYSAAPVLSEVDAYITDEMKRQNIPGLAVGIVKDGRIVHLKGYGQADSSGRAVTPDTPFMIGSNSKSITAMAVLQLVEEGKIDLDAPVQRYIPLFQVVGPHSSTSDMTATDQLSKDVSSSITVRHLLNQTSGLTQFPGDKTVPPTYNGTDALEKRTQIYTEGRVKLNRPVGQSYEYANDNYVLLGLIVQRVSGQSYGNYVKEHIFEPLSMHNTFVSHEEALDHGLATAHRRWFGFNVEYKSSHTFSRGDVPAGYIISSAEDMSHYLIAQLNDGKYKDVFVLSPTGINLMQTEPVPDTYAMGWLSDKVRDIPVIGHAGGSVGYQSHIWFTPEQRLGVVVMGNVLSAIDASLPNMEFSTASHIASDIISLISNRPLPDQGLSINQKYWIVNGVVLLLSVWLVFALVRVAKRYRRSFQYNMSGLFGPLWRAALIFLLHFIWPSAVFLMTITEVVPVWHVLTIYQPDLIIWLKIVAIVVFLKGFTEIGLLFRLFTKNHKLIMGG